MFYCNNLRLCRCNEKRLLSLLRAMVQVVSRRPHITEAQPPTRVRTCGNFGGQNSTGTDFLLRFLCVSPVNIIPPWLPIFIYHLGMNNRAVGGSSSET
jgi:hypothetical protein